MSGPVGTPLQTGNPFLGGRPSGPVTATPEQTRSWLPTALSVLLNVITLVGVIAWGWPPGNVYLLFWVENAILGLVTIPRIATARGTGPGTQTLINGRPASPAALAVFFCFHYGIFCLVHAGFTGFVAYNAGVRLSLVYLGLPIVLILIRYTVELATTWFGSQGRRWTTSPGRAMMQPYPRIIVLHVAIIVAFGVTISRMNGGATAQSWARFADPVLALLPVGVRTTGVLAVVILVVVKTVADVVTTRRVMR